MLKHLVLSSSIWIDTLLSTNQSRPSGAGAGGGHQFSVDVVFFADESFKCALFEKSNEKSTWKSTTKITSKLKQNLTHLKKVPTLFSPYYF